MREMTVQEVNRYLKNNSTPPLLLDVRESWEYNICHLPNVRLIPVRNVASALADLDREQEIIVICHHGVRSRLIANFLEQQQGFKNVINMQGGMAAWSRDVDFSVATY